MAGIYFHIPFCKQACYYCDFHFSTNRTTKDEMISAMTREIEIQREYLREPVETIYFGGGTPSLLDADDIERLLRETYSRFPIAPSAEITMEANPDDLSPSFLKSSFGLGINRLSIGIQSFDDQILKSLNRAHDGSTAVTSFMAARDAGFKNISVDLIYAIPGQDEIAWTDNIKKALSLQPEHLSAYSLTIEEKTVFGRWASKGKLHPVSEDTGASHFERLISELEDNGYEQYEISNFARQGFYSRHNSSYWNQQPYLGIGPSAHSYNIESRQFNVKNNHEYLRSLKKGILPATMEILTGEDKINDYLLTTLRTKWGADLKKLHKDFGFDLLQQQDRYIESLIRNKLAVYQNCHLTLTRAGRFLADKISADLFVAKRT